MLGSRICLVVLAIAIAVCSSASAGPHLSKQEAIRIANRRVREVLHYDLRKYDIYFVKYFPKKNKWEVNYRIRTWARDDFGVEINDSTKHAEVWLP